MPDIKGRKQLFDQIISGLAKNVLCHLCFQNDTKTDTQIQSDYFVGLTDIEDFRQGACLKHYVM